METPYWFLPLTTTGIVASTIAHCVTLVGMTKGLVIEGNPFAIFLSMGRLGVPLTSSIIGAAYLLTWIVGQRPARTQSDILAFRAAVIGMTVFFLLDMMNDLVAVF